MVDERIAGRRIVFSGVKTTAHARFDQAALAVSFDQGIHSPFKRRLMG
jgi:hypothetical protein